MMTLEEIQVELSKVLKKKRLTHTVGVRYTAQAMAMRFGENVDKAGYAGMLHDCAKYLSEKEMIEACQKYKLSITEAERRKPSLLHAKVGQVFAKEVYGITDDTILSAIRWHTTGKPGMSNLEKIIYIADYIEPNRRPLPQMEQIRKMAFADLNKTIYMILSSTLSYLEESKEQNNDAIDKYTIDAFDFYKENVE